MRFKKIRSTVEAKAYKAIKRSESKSLKISIKFFSCLEHKTSKFVIIEVQPASRKSFMASYKIDFLISKVYFPGSPKKPEKSNRLDTPVRRISI